MDSVFMQHPDLGRIFTPKALTRAKSFAGSPIKRPDMREIGVFVAVQKRPHIEMEERNGILIPRTLYMETLWASITHNERVDAGASKQARQVFAGGASPAAPSASAYFNAIAVASASLTKAKGDQSLGSTSANATTNEFTTIGLSRATADSPAGGDYTAPSSLGGTFSQIVKKTFTASGSGTAYGAGLFDSTTVSGSILYVEDNFASNAVLVSGDTLTVTITITN